MAHSEFDKAMKELELFHGLRVPVGAYTILRVDGRTFSKVTARLKLKKPFDKNFDLWMNQTTKALVENLGACYGYHQSDEISLLLARDSEVFSREVEKLVSVSAGLATAVFNRAMLMGADPGDADFEASVRDEFPHFDSRVIVACTETQVQDYFIWRMQDAGRNALNSYCHWTAIQEDGLSPTAAGKLFEEKQVGFKNEFLFKHGINFNEVPTWQKRGTGMVWVNHDHQGFNPITKETVTVTRRRVQARELDADGFSYSQMIKVILSDADFERKLK